MHRAALASLLWPACDFLLGDGNGDECFSTVPSDLAVQLDDGFQLSNAVCVDTSGA